MLQILGAGGATKDNGWKTMEELITNALAIYADEYNTISTKS